MNEVGRHFGGHIDMLKIIRENVGVLGSIKKKKIVFVIRDW